MAELNVQLPDFDDIADMFWRLGVMHSPSQLQGYLLGVISVGDLPTQEQWPDQAAAVMETVEPPNMDERRLLTQLYQAVYSQLQADEMSLVLLLPDDAAEITQRVDALGQWCKGFLTGFAMGGKALQQQAGPRQYSEEVSEVLNDMGAISQISLSEEDADAEQREQDYVEISEYLRVATMNIYLECNQPMETVAATHKASTTADKNLSSPANLFGKPSKQIH